MSYVAGYGWTGGDAVEGRAAPHHAALVLVPAACSWCWQMGLTVFSITGRVLSAWIYASSASF